jgi:hypothetical protein
MNYNNCFSKLIPFAWLLAMLISPTAQAGRAELMLSPTRFVLDGSQRTVAVDVINKGDATGSYRIEVVDMIMPEKGAIREIPEGQTDPYSLKAFARISPRKVVLKPGQDQTVRILLRKPSNLQDGEYRSHLKVTLTEDNLDEAENQKPSKNLAIVIKPRLAFTIPIILRQGETHYKVGIEHVRVYYAEQDTKKTSPMLELLFDHEGNRSSMGDIQVTHISPAGKCTVLTYFPGIAIYRNTDRRDISIPLTVPDGVDLTAGQLQISYMEQQREGGGLIATTKLKL